MIYALGTHHDTPVSNLAVNAEVRRETANEVLLRYRLTGNVDDIALPDQATPKRADNLWRHTCFEAFLRRPGLNAYEEWNFSPSTAWAAYAFQGYRIEMRPARLVREPIVGIMNQPDNLVIDIWIASDLLRVEQQLNLAAVIEAKDGTKSYWALAHAPGPPDFHNRDCFIATLPAPGRP